MEDKHYNQPNEKKSNRLQLVSRIAFVLFLFFAFFFSVLFIERCVEADKQESIKELRPKSLPTDTAVEPQGSLLPITPKPTVTQTINQSDIPTQEPTFTPEPTPTPIPERFSELYNTNPHFVGWLQIGNGIEGPVLFSGDDFYLDHDFYQKESKSGTLYIDFENSEWAKDPYVIIYGHNMKNGTMFGDLSEYRKLNYLKEYPLVRFDTLEEGNRAEYVPFAVFDISCAETHSKFFHLRRLSVFKNKEEEGIQALFSEVLKRSLWKTDVDVTEQDSILVLTTCSYEYPDGRLLLFCRRLRETETVEEISELIQQAKKN